MLAAAAATLGLAASAAADPVRTATTTNYTHATFLQHALGLPTTDTNPAIESVTYDRFQWLLQQEGDFAFLIGDPALDPSFKSRAQDVEAAAKAAGVKKVYWFDPNLSGSVTLGDVTVPNLDIRNPAGITSLTSSSQAVYGRVWLNVIGQYLGNGYRATPGTASGTERGAHDATVTTAPDATVVNDYGRTDGYSTKVGDTSGGALYDYVDGDAPEDVQDSVFFIYDKDRTVTPDGGTPQPAKIVSWVNLSDQTESAATRADVTTAIGKVGAANLDQLDQFHWWKSWVNYRQVVQAPQASRGSEVPVITDADDADTWRINQVTYPELVYLLQNATDANAVILFGGAWCPNTRPVIGAVNKYAQQNDVTVFNFDTVLDGGNVGGGTTSPSNPLQSRNTTGPNASSTVQNTPTYLYGEFVNRYLANIKTQYDPTTNNTVTYFPGGDTDGTLTRANKLQVPFLIGYQGNGGTEPNGGVTRQWIQQNDNGSYTEYMSQWWFTNPQPNQLDLTAIPAGAPIWSTINAKLATLTWQTDRTTLLSNTADDSDAAQYLVDGDRANVTYNPAGDGSISVSSSASGAVDISPAALAAAQAALGAALPASRTQVYSALVAAYRAEPQDPALIANLTTVAGAYGVVFSRKNTLNGRWGATTSPSSLLGGAWLKHELEVFFGGLPGGVVSRRTITANPVVAGTAPTISVAIANDFGRTPTGTLSLTVTQGGTTVATASAAVSGNAASFTLPALPAGAYQYTLSYPGDDQLWAFTDSGSLTVTPAPVDPEPTPIATPAATPAPTATPAPPTGGASTTVTKVKARKLVGKLAKKPTTKAGGRYKVTITAAKGKARATGRVTLKLKKGKVTKTIRGKLTRGTVTFKLPKLARGTWKVTISWVGDKTYRAQSVRGAAIRVTK